MSYVSIKDMSEEEAERKREQRRGYAKTYRAKQKAKAQEAEAQQQEQKQTKPEPEVIQVEQEQEEEQTGNGLRCSCGGLLVPDYSGMYPHTCKKCGEEVDYRGVRKLEESSDILVCDMCGGLTRLRDNEPIICQWCGQEYDGVQ